MDIRCTPAALCGSIPAIPSKSDAHRLLILASFADAPTRLLIPSLSKDIEATMDCIRALGAVITETSEGEYLVSPVTEPSPDPVLNCNESGSTVRFLLPVAMAVTEKATFLGAGRLPERPLSPLKEEMERHGCEFLNEKLPLTVVGKLKGNDFSLAGNVSSQFLSGILMALPLLGGGTLTLTTELESEGYVDITLSAMARFGVTVERTASGWHVPNVRYHSPEKLAAEGDWSNAAFWLTAGVLSNGIAMSGLSPASPQGDRA
ncbi:MAG: 3-phosphoshikimate 1-carboxyvinyltransferase, partial [Clostridia bacterium]|nr:3-phosphoshikimate 1-carboxyvinyltransferase [Clostridia bacterium]